MAVSSVERAVQTREQLSSRNVTHRGPRTGLNGTGQSRGGQRGPDGGVAARTGCGTGVDASGVKPVLPRPSPGLIRSEAFRARSATRQSLAHGCLTSIQRAQPLGASGRASERIPTRPPGQTLRPSDYALVRGVSSAYPVDQFSARISPAGAGTRSVDVQVPGTSGVCRLPFAATRAR